MNKGVSIIICCYNSENRIETTMTHIAKQMVPKHIPWEVILVDNNSKDKTKEVALSKWNTYKAPTQLNIVDQPIQGLSHAREKGINSAQYDYIIFCDDDNWLEKNYIKTAYQIMEDQPKVGAAGGEGFVASDIEIPDWFEEFSNGYAVGKQANQTGILKKRKHLWGAGIVLRKNLLQKVQQLGIQSLLSGRKGNELLAGDDSEMCRWILLLGYQLWYDEKLQFQHFIPQTRLTLEYKDRMWEGFKKSYYWMEKYDNLIKVSRMKRSKIINFFVGLKHHFFKTPGATPTYNQFLIGPLLKISDQDDYQLIKQYYQILYLKQS